MPNVEISSNTSELRALAEVLMCICGPHGPQKGVMHFDSSQAYMTKIGHVLGGDMTIVAMEFVQVRAGERTSMIFKFFIDFDIFLLKINENP